VLTRVVGGVVTRVVGGVVTRVVGGVVARVVAGVVGWVVTTGPLQLTPFTVKEVGTELVPLQLAMKPNATLPPVGTLPFHDSLLKVTGLGPAAPSFEDQFCWIR
jgi:hypothetical protein